MMKSGTRAALLIGVIALHFFVGCAAVESKQAESGGYGLSYSLPKSVIKIETVFSRGEKGLSNVDLIVSADLVPDRTATFALQSNTSVWTASSHHVVIQDGLLSSVSTTDTGEAGEVLEKSVTTAINIAKVVALLQSGVEKPFLTDAPYVTSEELIAVLEMVQGQRHSFHFDAGPCGDDTAKHVHACLHERNAEAKNGYHVLDIPSTSGLIRIEAQTIRPDKKIELKLLDAKEMKKMKEGVYVRTLEEARVSATVLIPFDRVKTHRQGEIKLELARLELAEKELTRRNADSAEAQDNACKGAAEKKAQLTAFEAELDRLSRLAMLSGSERLSEQAAKRESFIAARIAGLTTKLSKCGEARKRKKTIRDQAKKHNDEKGRLETIQTNLAKLTGPDLVVATTVDRVSIANLDGAYRVPVQRSWIGRTQNTLTFNKGILVSTNHERPAELAVAAGGLATASNTLYEGVLDILRTPQVLLGLEKDRVTEEAALTEEQIKLIRKNEQREVQLAESERLEAESQAELRRFRLDQIKENPADYLHLLEEEEQEEEEEPLDESRGDDGSGETTGADGDGTDDSSTAESGDDAGKETADTDEPSAPDTAAGDAPPQPAKA